MFISIDIGKPLTILYGSLQVKETGVFVKYLPVFHPIVDVVNRLLIKFI
jgi:hypothetical protein